MFKKQQQKSGIKIRPYYVFQTILNLGDDYLPIQVSFLADPIKSTHVLHTREEVEDYAKKFASGNSGVTFFKPVDGKICMDIAPYGEYFVPQDMERDYPPARVLSEEVTEEFVNRILEKYPLPKKVKIEDTETEEEV